MLGLSKRSTRLGSCCCAQLTEKQKQVKQIVRNQRTPLKVVKRRFACKANYRRQTTQPATAPFRLCLDGVSGQELHANSRLQPERQRVRAKCRKKKQAAHNNDNS